MTMPTDDERPALNAAEDDPSERMDPRQHPGPESTAYPDEVSDPDDS